MHTDALMRQARAIAAALAEHSVKVLEVVRDVEHTPVCARVTDLPTLLVELCAQGGEVVAPGIMIRAHADGLELIEASEAFRASMASARAMLGSLSDPPA